MGYTLVGTFTFELVKFANFSSNVL